MSQTRQHRMIFDEGYNSSEDIKKPSSPLKTNIVSACSQTQLKQFYSIREILFNNKTAQVYSGVCRKTKQPIIVKRILKGDNSQAMYELQFTQFANQIIGDLILPLLFVEETDKYLTSVQAKFGLSLYDFMYTRNAVLTEHEAKVIYKQLAYALYKLQKHNVYHLDVKEENVLIDPLTYQIKLIDFGCSSQLPVKSLVGSVEFAAPEIFKKKSTAKNIAKHDVWSFGTALFSSLTGQTPYNSMDEVLKNGVVLQNANHFSKDLKEVFKKVLVVDPNQRISFKKLLKMDFFSKED